MFKPDVTIHLDLEFKATSIRVLTGTGTVWFNRLRQRYNRALTGLSVDALTEEYPGVTFETIAPEIEVGK